MDITFNCDNCGQNLVVEEAGAGMTIDCPKCGKPVYVPSKTTTDEQPTRARVEVRQVSPYAKRAAQLADELDEKAELAKYIEKPHSRVVLTDVQIPFWSVVVLVFKVWVASMLLLIPTMLVMFLLSLLLGSSLTALFLPH